MSGLNFREVNTLVVDPDRGALDAIKMILKNNGFRNIREGASREDIEAAFKEEMPDILISECDLTGGSFHSLVHQLRHYEIGGNPFLPVIALSRQPTPEIVRAVVNSGADDLVPKPVSTGHLLKRIEILVNLRKPFVVTSEYIGPDRRTGKDRPAEIPLLDVPNTLKVKATGESDPDIDSQAIAAAIDEINIQKLERYAVQIGWLVERIVPKLQSGEFDKEVEERLKRLLYVAEDTSRRMGGTKYEHVSELCQSLIKVTSSLCTAGAKPDIKDVQLLPHLSQAIGQGFDSTEGTVASARAISSSIGR